MVSSAIPTERENEIRSLLGEAFQLDELRFEDFSHLHSGHNVQARHGGSHVHLYVRSPDFSGLSRVERARRVHEVLDALLSSGKIHALTLRLVSSEEKLK